MYVLNRSAVVLKPKQPFLDWLNSLPGDDKYTLNELRAEPTVILLPEFEDTEDEIRYLKKICSDLFSRQLYSWHTDESDWIEKKDWNTFQEWFDFELCCEVFDMMEAKIKKENV
jgi:hypothetical protein